MDKILAKPGYLCIIEISDILANVIKKLPYIRLQNEISPMRVGDDIIW